VDDREMLGRILDLAVDTNKAVHEFGREVAAHEARIGRTEQDVRDLKGDRSHEQREDVRDLKGDRTHHQRHRLATRTQLRTTLLVGVCTVLLSTSGSALVNILTR
jgi:hypothetical protein